MSDKIARLGIERAKDMMYYVKDGDVWATQLRRAGEPKGRPQKVASTGLEMDYSQYIYFLDRDGDVARKERALGGRPKPKTKAKTKAKPGTTSRSAITGHYVTAATAKRHPRTTVSSRVKSAHATKRDAQIAQEIEECLVLDGKKKSRR